MSRTYTFPLPTGDHAEMWYSRSTRSWVVQSKNAAGDQIGEAHYCYTKEEACVEVGYLKHMAMTLVYGSDQLTLADRL